MLDRRLLIVTGKGGVGRSAVATAIARHRASQGERVLAIAIDRGAGLAAHLGAAHLAHDPSQVVSGLWGSVVDPAAALDEYVRLRVPAPIALAARVFRVLALAVPGVRDVILIGKVWHEATRGEWDAVIVDAPPAGQIQSVLQAPTAIGDLVPRGPVHDQAMRMAQTLGDPAITGLVVVATPEELPLTEAAEVDASATRAGISPARLLVLNRVVDAPGFDSAPVERGARREAALLHLDVVRTQRQFLDRDPDATRLPLLFGSHGPVEISTELASRMGAT